MANLKEQTTRVLIGGFPVDVARTEEHSFDSDVTDHPVEKGSNVTDNIRPKPIQVTLECVVTDTPIGTMVQQRANTTKPSNDAFAHLLQIRAAREPVTIETSLKVFENMALTSLSVPRSSATGHALVFTATFIQIQYVTNARTTIRVSSARGQKKTNLGNLATKAIASPPVQVTAKVLRLVTALNGGA